MSTHEQSNKDAGLDKYGRPLIIQTGRAKGYHLDDPVIRKFWTEKEWDDENCFACGFVMDCCDCQPGQMGHPAFVLREAAEQLAESISHAVRSAKDVRRIYDGTDGAYSFDAVLQMLEHALGVVQALAPKPQ